MFGLKLSELKFCLDIADVFTAGGNVGRGGAISSTVPRLKAGSGVDTDTGRDTPDDTGDTVADTSSEAVNFLTDLV